MNTTLLEQARAKIPSVPILVNLVSKRMRELIAGKRPLVKPLLVDGKPTPEDKLDTVLREIADGKLIAEIDFASMADDLEDED